MKFRKLLGGGLLAAVLALGGVAGLATRSESEAVNAEGVSGTMTVDMADGYWAAGDSGWQCNLAMYFYQGQPGAATNPTWSDMVYCAKGTKYAEIPYSLTFTPSYMILVRLNSEAKSPNWDDKWNQSDDLAFVNNANFMVRGNNDGDVAVATAYVEGKSIDTGWDWAHLADLSSIKTTDAGDIEYFGLLTVTQWEEFLIYLKSGTSIGYDSVSFSDFIDKTKWTKQGTTNIQYTGEDTLTIEIFYNRVAGTAYITDPVAAAADEWAQLFLKGVKCDGEGAITKDEWSTLSGSYAVLDGDVKKIFEDISTHGKEDGTYAEAAVARYDYILIKYGIGASAPKHTDFMGRFGEGGINQNVPTAQAPISVFGSMDNSTPIMLVVIISVVSLTAVGGYIFLKRRKED